jgi:hypothetical protein
MKALVKLTCGIAAVMIFTAAQASAQVLAWDVQGSGTPFVATLSASTIDPNLATTSGLNELSRTTVTGINAGNAFASANWNITSTFSESSNYIGFMLTPASGFELNLTSLDYAVNGSNTAPRNGRWGYKIGAGSFVFQPDFTMLNPAPSALATWDFSDFTTSSSVEFRFWIWGATPIGTGTASATGGSGRIANITGNDLVLNGSVTLIPEPSTISLIGLGLLGALAFARRRSVRD